MIGGGGKIGGGPPGPRIDNPPTDAPKSQRTGEAQSQKPGDSFERGAAGKAAAEGAPKPAKLGKESSGSAEVLRLARENPAGARQLVATMASQTATTIAALEKEMAGARATLEQLAAEKFTKKAQAEKGRELKKKREKIGQMKMRLQLGARKMALLQQIAGKLGDPRLEEELDRLLSHHKKLKTDWGQRHHLMSIGETLYGDDAETPEHLREVMRADVRTGGHGEEVGNVLQEISPRRVIAELIARTLDGSVGEATATPDLGNRGEHGRAIKTWSAVRELVLASLDTDPLAKEK
jgi:hypothetical protein